MTVLSLVMVLFLGVAASAALAKGSVDRVGPFVTVVPVAFTDTGVELMFAKCDFVQRVEKPDGSSVETQRCQLTEPFFEFPGMPPERAFNAPASAPCVWFSDYVIQTEPEGDTPSADRVRLTVTPSSKVNVTTMYGPNPTLESEC